MAKWSARPRLFTLFDWICGAVARGILFMRLDAWLTDLGFVLGAD